MKKEISSKLFNKNNDNSYSEKKIEQLKQYF